MTDEAKTETRVELWSERPGDFCADNLFVTDGNGIGMNVGGNVVIKPLKEWHRLAVRRLEASPSTSAQGEISEAQLNAAVAAWIEIGPLVLIRDRLRAAIEAALSAHETKGQVMVSDSIYSPAERSAYANGYHDCRRKFEERPEFNNWHGKPLGDMSRGELIDALAWCVAELRKASAPETKSSSDD